MSYLVTISCDGHRHGQPCRGRLSTRTTDLHRALEEAVQAGWRRRAARTHLCPSAGHDEDQDT